MWGCAFSDLKWSISKTVRDSGNAVVYLEILAIRVSVPNRLKILGKMKRELILRMSADFRTLPIRP